ncbi:MAG TPA: tetratricopeptide repeat protein [Bacteroidia bacterium]|jgi:tetratricopeptide (TPR) repeat protein|nr:tetratricopeptide repeat protein [Bacteroidia bacterium]
MKKYFLIVLLFPLALISQTDDGSLGKVSAKTAEDKLAAGNFEDAIPDYVALHAQDPQNEKYAYNLAVCYLNYNGNKTKAVPYLEKITHNAKHDPNADYLLGRAYQYALRFDDAIAAFTRFTTTGKGKEDNLKDAEQQIQYCLNAKERVKYPLDVTFENLGKAVNSEYNDYYAFVPLDESFVIYNSKRPFGDVDAKPNGEYPNVIMISEVTDGKYQPAKKLELQLPKGTSNAEVIGLSANGNTLILYISDAKGNGNIYTAERSPEDKFGKPFLLDKQINSPTSDEIAASISAEGDLIYFASNRAGGLGGTDIYACRKTPQGTWGLPQNLGKEINTPQNEDFPNISPDGKTLYYSSTGHSSMGGYDVFKATKNEDNNTWENTKNIGYPVNTPLDDYNFRVSKSSRYGYISAIKDGGLGDYDNYRITFNDVEPELTVMYGQVLSEDGTQINFPDVLITVTGDKNGELLGTYLPNAKTGKYVVILPPGKYTLTVELFDFKLLTKKLEILDKISFQSEVEFDLKLQIQK